LRNLDLRKLPRQTFPEPLRHVPQRKTMMHNNQKLHVCENLITESVLDGPTRKISDPVRSNHAGTSTLLSESYNR
jgi:hypothetical protein